MILPTTSWPRLKPFAEVIARGVLQMHPGDYVEWTFPTP